MEFCVQGFGSRVYRAEDRFTIHGVEEVETAGDFSKDGALTVHLVLHVCKKAMETYWLLG
jgi:hypothetical protein